MEVTVHFFQYETPVKLNTLSFLENRCDTTEGQPELHLCIKQLSACERP